MLSLGVILLLLALLCFVLAAAAVPFGRIDLAALGLAFLTLYVLLM